MQHVYKMAVRVYRQLGRRVELGDLVAFGTEGLLEAADRFDPSRGAKFVTFAYYRIQGSMMDGVRKLSPMPSSVYQRELRRQGEWEMRVPRRRADVPDGPADESAGRAQMARRLRRAMSRLPAKERELLEGHYFAGDNLCDAGARVGVSKSWASRLHARAIDNLRQELAA